MTLHYGDGGGPGPSTPTITGVNPTSLTWAATETAGKTLTVSGTDLNGLTTSTPTNFNASVSGTTVTVTPKAANSGASDISETLTIYATGGNSIAVPLTHKAAGASGGDLTLVTTVAGLSNGTYYMAGWANNAYNVWNGTLSYLQCVTSPYSFAGGKLTATSEFDDMSEVTLEAVSGVSGAFYIKNKDGQYLTVNADGKNTLSLADTADNNYWNLSDYDENGVKASSNAFASNMFTSTSAQSRFIRNYVTTNTTGVGGIAFFKKN
jgi:hypothetical protein